MDHRQPVAYRQFIDQLSVGVGTWEFIKETGDQARLEAFIGQFGDNAFAPIARARLEELRKRQTAAPYHRM